MSNIQIITNDEQRLFPAKVYAPKLKGFEEHFADINHIIKVLEEEKCVYVISRKYNKFGEELEPINDTISEKDIKSIMQINDAEDNINLSNIITLSEAAEKWGLADGSTIRKSIERGKFAPDEIKQAGSVWITTYNAMEKVFGKIRNEADNYIIDYDKLCSMLMIALLGDSKVTIMGQIKHKSDEIQTILSRITDKTKSIHQEIIQLFKDAIDALSQDRKVIIKNVKNDKIIEVFNTKKELLTYVDLLDHRRLMTGSSKEQLLDALLK